MKHSLIGFDKKDWKSAKYDNHVHNVEFLASNVTFVRFAYGPTDDPQYHKPVVGKILKYHDQGLEVLTDYGYMFPTWDRIARVFIAKTAARLKETKVKAAVTNIQSNVGILDGTVNKIVVKVKAKFPNVKIKDERLDLSTRFNRVTTFRNGHQTIILTIADEKTNILELTGTALGRHSSLKVNGKGKITPQQIHHTVKKISALN